MRPGTLCSRYKSTYRRTFLWALRTCLLSRPDIAREHFAFVDRDIRFGDEMREVVDDIARRIALPAPVPRQADFVHELAVDVKGTHTARHERTSLDLPARRADRHKVCGF